MTQLRRRLARLVAAVALLAVPQSLLASGFTVITPQPNASATAPPTNAAPFFHWDLREMPNCQVPYRVNQAGAAALGYAATAAQVANAFAQWQAVTPALIRFADNGAGVGTAVRAAANDNENCIFWDVNLCSGDAWDPGLRGGAIGITCLMGASVIPASATGIITNCDIVFDDQHFTWSAAVQNAPALVGGDDALFVQTLVGGNRRIVIADGGNGRCESMAVCGDVQVVAVGPCAANAVLVTPAAAAVAPPAPPTPLAGSQPNLAGTMDVWNIACHEIGHFCGLGENNANTAGFGVSETLGDGPFVIPAGGTLTFTINGNPVNVALTAGNRTAAQVVAEINAAIAAQAAGQANAIAGPTGSVEIRGTALATDILVITGGTAAGALGMLTGESGAATMSQSPQGLIRLDQRTLSRHDWDGLNFLYTHDLGDAPDNGNGSYQTFVHSNTNGRMLSGVQLMQPAIGPLHLFGWPPFRWEWLGANEDGSDNECEALTVNMDKFDDGVGFTGGRFRMGENNRVTVLVSSNEPGGRFINIPNSRLYFNGYFDVNLNKLFDPGERLIFWNGVPGTTNAASGNFVPGASNLGTNPMKLVFDVFVPIGGAPTESLWVRGRLDYGEDEGRVANINADLGPAVRVAQFGEVEDYPVPASPRVLALTCPEDVFTDHAHPVQVQFCVDNLTDEPQNANYSVVDQMGWVVSSPGASSGQFALDPFGRQCVTLTLRPDENCAPLDKDSVCFIITPPAGVSLPETCCVVLQCSMPTPTLLSRFEATPGTSTVDLAIQLADERGYAGIVVDRTVVGAAGRTRVTDDAIRLDGSGVYRFTDRGVTPGTNYRYDLSLVDVAGREIAAGVVWTVTQRAAFALGAPKPNPTSTGFAVTVSTPIEGRGLLRVFDVSGRVVRRVFDGPLAVGEHTLRWDGRRDDHLEVGSGLYFVVFEAAGHRASQRVVVVR